MPFGIICNLFSGSYVLYVSQRSHYCSYFNIVRIKMGQKVNYNFLISFTIFLVEKFYWNICVLCVIFETLPSKWKCLFFSRTQRTSPAAISFYCYLKWKFFTIKCVNINLLKNQNNKHRMAVIITEKLYYHSYDNSYCLSAVGFFVVL